MARTLYVGQGGVNTRHDSPRKIVDRLAQQYQANGQQLSGQTFYRNWLKKQGLCQSDANAREFLSQFNQWRLTTLTTDQEPAIALIPAIEAIFIYLLRPEYNKPYPSNVDIQNARSLDQALYVTFMSTDTGFNFVVC